MKPHASLSRILLAGAIVFSVSIVRQQTYSAQSTSQVQGVVLDAATGKPLPGVKVSTDPEQRPSVEPAVTDAQGRFKIDGVHPGYRVVPSFNGFVFLPPAIQSARGIQLRMIREGIIAGRIFDSSGQPGGIGFVALFRWQYDQFGKRSLIQMQGGPHQFFQGVDDRGQYRFFGLLPGDYYIQTSDTHTGTDYYYPGTYDQNRAEPVHVGPGEEVQLGTLTVQSKKIVRIRFHFKDAEGPLPTFRQVYFEPDLGFRTNLVQRDEIVSTDAAFGTRDALVEWRLGAAGDGDLMFSHFVANGDSDIDRDIVMSRAFRITTDAILEAGDGKRSSAAGTQCLLQSEWLGTWTLGLRRDSRNYAACGAAGWIIPGFYRLELQNIPAGSYVVSAKTGDQDILAKGFQVNDDVHLEVLLATGGGVVNGVVRNADGDSIATAVVALVPDAPLREAGPLYRSATSDRDGNFELRGIAPGAYHLFAWPELPGAAYRNADFMKQFDDRGTPVTIQKQGAIVSIDLLAF